MKTFINYVLARLQEKSTVFTLVTLLVGGIGLTVSPELSNAIATAVVSVISAIAIATKEEKKPDA